MRERAVLKKLLRKGFNLLGLEVRSVGARYTLAQTISHVSSLGFRPRTIIDVGGGHGTPWLDEGFADAKFLLVEPLEEFEQDLVRICERYDASYVLAAATQKQQESIWLRVHAEHLEGSSAFDIVNVADAPPREVPTVRVDALCEARGLPGPYVIKVDVHGTELEVIGGATSILDETELIIIEASFFEFYKGGAQFTDVIKYMAERGFVVYDLSEKKQRPLDGALAQVDVTFVKEDGMFRRSHDYELAKS